MKSILVVLVLFISFFLFPSRAFASSYNQFWEASISGNLSDLAYRTAPVVDGEGNIYAAASKQVISVTSEGKKRWERGTTNSYFQVAYVDSRLVLIDSHKVIFLNTANGDQIWETTISDENINITVAPQVLGGKVYLTYSKTSPGSTWFKLLSLTDGHVIKEVNVNPDPPFGLVTTDLAIPHLAESSARLFAVTSQKSLISISRDQLSINLERNIAETEFSYPALNPDDSILYYAKGNVFTAARVISNGRLSTSQVFTVDLGKTIRSKPVFANDLVIINVGTSGQALELVAVNKDTGLVVWRRAIDSIISTRPFLVGNDKIALVSNKLVILNLLNGELIQEVLIGNELGQYFTGGIGVGDNIVFVNRDKKLVSFGLAPPKHNPVIFIHGLGGHPGDWDLGGNKAGFKTKLLDKYRSDQPDYPAEWLVSYSYTGVDRDTGGYNNQGRVEDISAGLEQAVASVSAQHKAVGGDGKVDLVGFSLGGLVIREYLATHPNNHLARKCITIGTPHQGSFLADIKKGFNTLGLSDSIRELVEDFADQALNEAGFTLSVNSEAISYLYTDSPYFLELQSKVINKKPIFDTVAGNLNLEFQQKILYYTVKDTLIDVGDSVVSKSSAFGISPPLEQGHKWSFRQSLPVPLFFIHTGGAPGLAIDFPLISSLRYIHTYLPLQDEVQQLVVDDLYDNVEDDWEHG